MNPQELADAVAGLGDALKHADGRLDVLLGDAEEIADLTAPTLHEALLAAHQTLVEAGYGAVRA